jgi:hypothetical protein
MGDHASMLGGKAGNAIQVAIIAVIAGLVAGLTASHRSLAESQRYEQQRDHSSILERMLKRLDVLESKVGAAIARIDERPETPQIMPERQEPVISLKQVEEKLDLLAKLVGTLTPGTTKDYLSRQKDESHVRIIVEQIGADPGVKRSAFFAWSPAAIYSHFGRPDSVMTSGQEVFWDYRLDPMNVFRVKFSGGSAYMVGKYELPERD